MNAINVENNQQNQPSENDLPLGQILKNKRQQMGIASSVIASQLKIKIHDFEAIEDGDLSKITSHLYITGLLRSYAKFLKIDPQIVEEKIKSLPIESNTSNKRHQLLNIGENNELSPDKDTFFNFLIVSILLFLTLLSIYNFFENKSKPISSETINKEFQKIEE